MNHLNPNEEQLRDLFQNYIYRSYKVNGWVHLSFYFCKDIYLFDVIYLIFVYLMLVIFYWTIQIPMEKNWGMCLKNNICKHPIKLKVSIFLVLKSSVMNDADIIELIKIVWPIFRNCIVNMIGKFNTTNDDMDFRNNHMLT